MDFDVLTPQSYEKMVSYVPDDAGSRLTLWVLTSYLNPDFEALDSRLPLPHGSTVPRYCQFYGEVQEPG